MDLAKIRDDFPALKERVNGKPVIYFDNACMTLKPRCVIDAMNEYYEHFPACGGRSVHRWGTIVTEKVAEAREKVMALINATMPSEIVFTKNTTEGINLVARSFGFEAGDVVITTDKEHNSNLVPWHVMQDLVGIRHKVCPSNEDGTFNIEAFKSMMSEGNVKLVSMVHTSNLDGYTIPAKDIIEIAHDHGAMVMLDGAQSVPHRRVDVQQLDVDFLAFSVHKMMGPTGMGVLYGKYEVLNNLMPFIAGGDTVELTTYEDSKFLKPPQKFEGGLQNYAGIIGTGAAAEYLMSIGPENIMEHEHTLNKYVSNGIKDIDGLHIIGPEDPEKRSGIVSIYVDGISPHDIAMTLDDAYNIYIRSGAHCVHSWFHSTGISGSARASMYVYNTLEEAKTFVDAITEIVSMLRGGV